MTSIRVIGRGRAGCSLAAALSDAGAVVTDMRGRGDDLADAAAGVDVLVIATPDGEVARVAAAVTPVADTVVVHMSGSLGLDVLAPHARRGSLHPLVPLPTPEVGRIRLRAGISFAVAGDPAVTDLVTALGGEPFVVDDADRATYHAAACVAANHVVALMGQVERIASSAGLGLEPFVALARAALDDVAALGPAGALTGPAARRDLTTLARHRAALPAAELAAYDAGAELAGRLAASRSADAAAADAAGAALRVITTAAEFSAALDAERAALRTVGLVPTMGALHAGHQSLIERAASECDVVAVTVFVNPLQFNDSADLAAYPRTLEADMALAAAAGAHIVFAPAVREMYPGFPQPPRSTVHVAGVGDGLEGGSRPGHFDGVATVVAKLFALAGRCHAYFGEKDFQQLAVVRRMTADLSLPVEIVGCPTVRERDGLALSSRNVRLSDDERRAALVLHRALVAGQEALRAGERRAHVVTAAMAAEFAREPSVVPDYVAAVDAATLEVSNLLQGEVRLLVAAAVGPVRLIDNVGAVLAPAPAPARTLSPARRKRRVSRRVSRTKIVISPQGSSAPPVTITAPVRTGAR